MSMEAFRYPIQTLSSAYLFLEHIHCASGVGPSLNSLQVIQAYRPIHMSQKLRLGVQFRRTKGN